MNERYRPKALVRERVAKGAGATSAISSTVLVAPVVAPVLVCNHDVPWRECTTCSKPRVK